MPLEDANPGTARTKGGSNPHHTGDVASRSGGGEMGALMRAKDWSTSPLGPVESWSPALRTMTSILLANRFPMLLWWGPDSISIYNDAYIPVLGAKHPEALGLPVRECWSEIYDVLRPLILTPLSGGPPTWSEDLPLDIRCVCSPVPGRTSASGRACVSSSETPYVC